MGMTWYILWKIYSANHSHYHQLVSITKQAIKATYLVFGTTQSKQGQVQKHNYKQRGIMCIYSDFYHFPTSSADIWPMI